MRRLLVALAALLSACGDTYIIQGGWPDGGSAVADGSVGDAAVPVFDARVPDARVAPDARPPDAALPPDARPPPDAADNPTCGAIYQQCCFGVCDDPDSLICSQLGRCLECGSSTPASGNGEIPQPCCAPETPGGNGTCQPHHVCNGDGCPHCGLRTQLCCNVVNTPSQCEAPNVPGLSPTGACICVLP
jgi:hypothetical protein